MTKNELEQKLERIRQNNVEVRAAGRKDSCFVAVHEQTVYKNPLKETYVLSRGQGLRIGRCDKGWDPNYKITHDVCVGLVPKNSITAIEEGGSLYMAHSDFFQFAGDHPLLSGPVAYRALLTWRSSALLAGPDKDTDNVANTSRRRVKTKFGTPGNVLRFSLQDGTAQLRHTPLGELKQRFVSRRAVVAAYNPFPSFYMEEKSIDEATHALYDAHNKKVVMAKPAYPHQLNILELGVPRANVYPKRIKNNIYFGYGVPLHIVELLADTNKLEWDVLMDLELRRAGAPNTMDVPIVTLHRWNPQRDLLNCADLTKDVQYAPDAHQIELLRRDIKAL